ncbi:MAG: hypothetical protein Tsb002_10950 [Wenzhouxiangellaceae bacterium]
MVAELNGSRQPNTIKAMASTTPKVIHVNRTGFRLILRIVILSSHWFITI